MTHTIPGFPELKAEVKVHQAGRIQEIEIMVVDSMGVEIGYTAAILESEFAPITGSHIYGHYKGKGLYPKMLMLLLTEVQARGHRGIVSEATGRLGNESTASWQKFAARESRVTSSRDRENRINYYLAGLHSSAKEPVYMECESHFSRLLNETIYGKCIWHVDPSVVSALIECKKTKTLNVLSRNMDSQRGIYPWRLSFFDKETGEAIGHRYGRTAAEALNFNHYDQCSVVDVKRK
jgi:hypothetical protein